MLWKEGSKHSGEPTLEVGVPLALPSGQGPVVPGAPTEVWKTRASSSVSHLSCHKPDLPRCSGQVAFGVSFSGVRSYSRAGSKAPGGQGQTGYAAAL